MSASTPDPPTPDLAAVLQRQGDPDDHDRGLILQRLAWTPEQRLDANTAFLRFYLSVRPDGPVLPDDRT